MQDYLRSVWAMLTPFKEETTPLLLKHHDLEACGHGACDSIQVVCESPVPAQFERVSPFSEYHFPARPLVLTSEA